MHVPQKRMNLSQKQLQALMQTRRRLLTDIGTLLAEREQLAAKIRVRRNPCCPEAALLDARLSLALLRHKEGVHVHQGWQGNAQRLPRADAALFGGPDPLP